MFWLWQRPAIRLRTYALGLILGLLSVAPFLWYGVHHDFVNLKAMARFVVNEAPLEGGNAGSATGRLSMALPLFDRMLPATGLLHLAAQALALAGGVLLVLRLRAPDRRSLPILLPYAFAPLLYAFWPGSPSIRYLVVFYPLPFLLLGLAADALRRQGRLWSGLSTGAVALIVLVGGYQTLATLRQQEYRPGDYVFRYGTVEEIVDHILEEADGQPFNLRVVSANDRSPGVAASFIYLLRLRNRPPVDRPDAQTFVVYDPADYELAAVEQGYIVDGVEVVKFASLRAAGY